MANFHKFSFLGEEITFSVIEQDHTQTFIEDNRKASKKPKPKSTEPTRPGTFTIALVPTTACNLNCSYCFMDKSQSETISYEISAKAIKYFVLEYSNDYSKYIIDFSGAGEPLLCLDLILQLDRLCYGLSQEVNKEILFMFVSNGILLKKLAEKLPLKSKLLFGVSLDGDAKNNSYRFGAQSQKITSNIIDDVKKLSKHHNIGVSSTLTQNSPSPNEIYRYFHNLKIFSSIALKPERSNKDQLEEVSFQYQIQGYRDYLVSLFNLTDQELLESMKPMLNGSDTLGKYIKKIITDVDSHNRCDGGRSKISVAPNGDYFICPAAINHQEAKIGDVLHGVDPKKQKFFEAPTNTSKECQKCWARSICGGPCFVTSLSVHQDTHKPIRSECAFIQGMIELAIGFVAVLQEKRPDLYEQMKLFAYKTNLYSHLDPGIFALLKLSKAASHKVSYQKNRRISRQSRKWD
jgi:radical SAM protein with 4Fe4S-binding SPASM domain